MNEISDKSLAITSLNLRDFYKIPRYVKDFYAIPQYIAPKTCVSPILLDKSAKNSQKINKNEQELTNLSLPLRKVTVTPQKNHVFLEEIAKYRRNSPSPNEYQRNSPWFPPQKREIPKKLVKIAKKLEVLTKPRETPGVGDYNLLETEEKLAKKFEKLNKLAEIRKKFTNFLFFSHKNTQRNSENNEKTQFLNETLFLASETPGPGAYNPRFPFKIAKSLSPLRENSRKPQEIRQKLEKHSKSPDNFLKYTPLPVDFLTFQRYERLENVRKRKEKGKKLAFFTGNDKRFRYFDEKLGFEPGPAPNQYNLKDFWAKAGRTYAKNTKNTKNNDFFV